MCARLYLLIFFVVSAEPGEILSEAKEDLIVASDIVQGYVFSNSEFEVRIFF